MCPVKGFRTGLDDMGLGVGAAGNGSAGSLSLSLTAVTLRSLTTVALRSLAAISLRSLTTIALRSGTADDDDLLFLGYCAFHSLGSVFFFILCPGRFLLSFRCCGLLCGLGSFLLYFGLGLLCLSLGKVRLNLCHCVILDRRLSSLGIDAVLLKIGKNVL